jgi:hypothetical protein
MSVQRFNSLPELIANLGPIELKLYDELGAEDYLLLMDLWASVEEDSFDEWYDNTDADIAEHAIELSQIASQITKIYEGKKLLH